MVTEQFTKSEFIVEILNRDVVNIFRAQLLIAEKNIRLQGAGLKQVKRYGKKIGVRSGNLLESLREPGYSIAGVNGTFQMKASVPLQTRFLDMKHRGNWMIYNRQIWGILYRNTKIDLKYRYRDDIRDTLGAALQDAFNSK